LRNMTVLLDPVAPKRDDVFAAKALQIGSRNPAGCGNIAQESSPPRSAAAADALYLAMGRPFLLIATSPLVCGRVRSGA
jgi:hypothetical protein